MNYAKKKLIDFESKSVFVTSCEAYAEVLALNTRVFGILYLYREVLKDKRMRLDIPNPTTLSVGFVQQWPSAEWTRRGGGYAIPAPPRPFTV